MKQIKTLEGLVAVVLVSLILMDTYKTELRIKAQIAQHQSCKCYTPKDSVEEQ